MTHSLSVTAADSPPAMYRSATLAMVVSSTSMNVGMTTATATTQGLIAGRLTAGGARATLLMRRAPWRTNNVAASFQLAGKTGKLETCRHIFKQFLTVWGPWEVAAGTEAAARPPRHAVPWPLPCSTRRV